MTRMVMVGTSWPHAHMALTISSKTSPAAKLSPSFFFHDAMPPSVMVGLIAGMANLESAWREAETWKPGRIEWCQGLHWAGN